MPQEGAQVVGDRRNLGSGEGGYLDLLDHLRQKRRLRQDLQVDEAGCRLENDRFQGRAAVEPAGGKDVANRNGEQEAPGKRGPPAPDPAQQGQGTATDGMVAVIDRFQERIKVRRGPAGFGRGDEDNRVETVGQPLLDRLGPADPLRRDHEGVGGPISPF